MPSHAELAAAVEMGAEVRFGLPVWVALSNGDTAHLDLAAAAASHPDPWYVVNSPIPGITILRTCADLGIGVGTMAVPEADCSVVLAALAAMPHESARHDPNADEARRRAGAIALRITDVMIRARVLDALDAWAALLGECIDSDPKHGDLHKTTDRGIGARLLRVVCPSTARVYVLAVPQTMTRASDARRWTLGLSGNDPDPEVES